MIIQRFAFKRKKLRELSDEAWNKEVDADFYKSLIPDLEKLIAIQKEKQEQVAHALREYGASPITTYESRKQAKAAGAEFARMQGEISQREKQIALIRSQAAQLRMQAAEVWVRREFVKKHFAVLRSTMTTQQKEITDHLRNLRSVQTPHVEQEKREASVQEMRSQIPVEEKK